VGVGGWIIVMIFDFWKIRGRKRYCSNVDKKFEKKSRARERE
jgi:hypothetical protein